MSESITVSGKDVRLSDVGQPFNAQQRLLLTLLRDQYRFGLSMLEHRFLHALEVAEIESGDDAESRAYMEANDE